MLHAKRLAEFTSRQFDGPDLGEDVERRPSGLPKRAVVQVPDEQNVLEAPGNEYYDPLYRTVQNNYGLFREYASGFPKIGRAHV